MRIKELDTSHRCLLQHLETFRKMMTSYEEIRGYVNGVLQELARDLNQQSSLLKFDEKFDEKTIPKGYLEAADIQAWKGTNDALVSIGLEGFDQGLGAIVGSSAVDQCRACVLPLLLVHKQRYGYRSASPEAAVATRIRGSEAARISIHQRA